MPKSPHSDTTTNRIQIHAAAQYLPRESEPHNRRFVFAYRITMTNHGTAVVRLQSRHWIIVDSDGRREDVRGRGVMGEYPKLAPGESYSYVSFCPLATPWGTMEGSYQFEGDDGEPVEAAIGRFFLVPSAPPLPVEASPT